ncbi:hypothetical protein EXIGLDRAFT_434582 [Exidia glandulosa HHB12029]|uniref:Uncharacterized protein n=1 Tax=Exidia glandulosa HHB12029 TaxID=1314781 RepID=A0A165KEY8_EXIGL|nr:hypothetical protein EXIGLDRAFT_434582 [Exidia glandulosa HHB12029]
MPLRDRQTQGITVGSNPTVNYGSSKTGLVSRCVVPIPSLCAIQRVFNSERQSESVACAIGNCAIKLLAICGLAKIDALRSRRHAVRVWGTYVPVSADGRDGRCFPQHPPQTTTGMERELGPSALPQSLTRHIVPIITDPSRFTRDQKLEARSKNDHRTQRAVCHGRIPAGVVTVVIIRQRRMPEQSETAWVWGVARGE